MLTYVVRLVFPPVWLGAHHHWEQDVQFATQFETWQQAEDAIQDLGWLPNQYVIETYTGVHDEDQFFFPTDR